MSSTAAADEHDYDALGFDPAPGELGRITSLAERYTKISTTLGDAHEALSKVSRDGGFWQGQAASAFQASVHELPDLLDRGHRSLGDAAKALGGWRDDLAVMQRQAADLERQASQARERAKRAERNPDLDLAGQEFPDEQSLRAAQSKLDAARAELDAARDELEAIRDRAQRLQAQHTELAEAVAKALNKARELAPEEPGFFERLGAELGELIDDSIEAVGNTLEEFASEAWQVVQDNANLIANLSDVAADLSVVTGLLGDVVGSIPHPVAEGVGLALGGVSLGLQVGALGGHSLAKAAGGDVPPEVLAADAAGVVTGTIGVIPVVGSEISLAMDVGTLGVYGGMEAVTGGEATTFFDDLEDYWVPRNPAQVGMYGAGVAVPGLALGVPLWNAVESGIEEDQAARAEQEKSA